ncbi:MAG: hypothetical protein K6F78_09570 [Bacteroidaceae bacterium]|nr:hypothetical protein [Bacteroidaceae bacterium]
MTKSSEMHLPNSIYGLLDDTNLLFFSLTREKIISREELKKRSTTGAKDKKGAVGAVGQFILRTLFPIHNVYILKYIDI